MVAGNEFTRSYARRPGWIARTPFRKRIEARWGVLGWNKVIRWRAIEKQRIFREHPEWDPRQVAAEAHYRMVTTFGPDVDLEAVPLGELVVTPGAAKLSSEAQGAVVYRPKAVKAAFVASQEPLRPDLNTPDTKPILPSPDLNATDTKALPAPARKAKRQRGSLAADILWVYEHMQSVISEVAAQAPSGGAIGLLRAAQADPGWFYQGMLAKLVPSGKDSALTAQAEIYGAEQIEELISDVISGLEGS